MTPTRVRRLLHAVEQQSDHDLNAVAGIMLMVTLTVTMAASIGLFVLALG